MIWPGVGNQPTRIIAEEPREAAPTIADFDVLLATLTEAMLALPGRALATSHKS